MSIFDRFKKNPLKNEIKKLGKNAIIMDASEGDVPPDKSKIGGKPYLPKDFVWPEFTSQDDGENRPLSFFCQLNLEEIKHLDKDNVLPDKGIISFFYECYSLCWGFDPKDKGAARVFYFENTDGFIPTDLPEEIYHDYRIPEQSLAFRPKISYPMFDEFDTISDTDCDFEEYDEALSSLGVDTDTDPEGHKILGYADIIQSEMLTECERSTRGIYSGDAESYINTPQEVKDDINKSAKEWTLLLQLNTIQTDDFEFMFGDCGMLYWYIKKSDLANRNFDNTWFVLQCF